MAKKDFFLEDAILDDISQGLDLIERPVESRTFVLLGGVIMVIVVGVIIRLLFMGGIMHGAYASRAHVNAGQQVVAGAPRGIIYDRFGSPLVKNNPSFSVSVNLSEVLKREQWKEDIRSFASIIEYDPEAVILAVQSANLEKESYVPLVRGASLSDIIELKKIAAPFLVIEEGYTREYNNGKEYAHIVGYTGFSSYQDIKENKSLGLNDQVGKTGLEMIYDDYLRGQKGISLVLRDALGNVIETKQEEEVMAGSDIYTTLDGPLQEYVYKTLSQQLSALGRVGGVGMVMDVETGGMLAMVSLPSYDNNNLTSDLFVDPNRPVFNRSIGGLYSPGSTIKPLVALGALADNIIDPLSSILSVGYIEVPNPYNPNAPSRFVDWKAHGWVNMYSALARSSNVYFYEIGGGFESQKGLGIERLKHYWQVFALDKKTGIDLSGEEEGFLPDPEWKERVKNDIWRLGDTYNVSIGQGDLLVTPLALLRQIAAIASGGILYEPYVAEYGVNQNDVVVYSHQEKKEDLEFSAQDIATVEQGMKDAVTKDYGTAHLLASIPMSIAAKTGSAQIAGNTKTNALFVGYITQAQNNGVTKRTDPTAITTNEKEGEAPQQIAVLVLIEDAKEGGLNAVPVARDIFEWYYNNRITPASE